MYLLVQHPNEHGDVARTTVGPMSAPEAVLFAKAIRFARNPRTSVVKAAETPDKFVTIVNPNDLFPFSEIHLPTALDVQEPNS
jgi:hypothetical protein